MEPGVVHGALPRPGPSAAPRGPPFCVAGPTPTRPFPPPSRAQASPEEARAAEASLLQLSGAKFETREVPCGPSPEHRMHTVSCGDEGRPPVVLMHGYAAGLGFYFKNLEALSQHYRLHCVDWLGKGLSGRPAFRARGTAEAEAFFVDALEEWRRGMGLERFILVGHSIGGYLSAQYALRHPERVEKLVLVGPAGVPLRPAGWEDGMRERMRERVNITSYSWRAALLWLMPRLWEAGITHGSVVRLLGPLGKSLTEGYSARRFVQGEGFSDAQRDSFGHYMYQITAARGSGEFALRHLLEPFAWARQPIGPRLHQLRVPLSFIYGDSDWMRPAAGREAAEAARERRGAATPTDLTVRVIPGAGHFCFIDQPEAFHAALAEALAPHVGPRAWDGRAFRTSFAVPEASDASDAVSAEDVGVGVA